MSYYSVRVIGIGLLVFAGLGTATWLALGGTDQPTVQGNPAEPAKAAKTTDTHRIQDPSQIVEQAPQKKGDAEVHTDIVRRLLKALDDLPDVQPEERRQLRRILLDSDRQLVQALKSPEAPHPASKESKRKEQKRSHDGETAPSNEGPRSPLIKALLELLDDIPEDSVADRNSHDTDTLRENLLKADKILAQHLGQSAVNRIKAANRKPAVPRVFNPPRKAPAQPSQENNGSEKTTQ